MSVSMSWNAAFTDDEVASRNVRQDNSRHAMFVTKGRLKDCHIYPYEVQVRCSFPFFRPWARRWMIHWNLWRTASATRYLRLPSPRHRSSLLFHRYQFILLVGLHQLIYIAWAPASTLASHGTDFLSQSSSFFQYCIYRIGCAIFQLRSHALSFIC